MSNANHQAVLKDINSAIRFGFRRAKAKRVQKSFEAGVRAIENALRGLDADCNNTVTRRIGREMKARVA